MASTTSPVMSARAAASPPSEARSQPGCPFRIVSLCRGGRLGGGVVVGVVGLLLGGLPPVGGVGGRLLGRDGLTVTPGLPDLALGGRLTSCLVGSSAVGCPPDRINSVTLCTAS